MSSTTLPAGKRLPAPDPLHRGPAPQRLWRRAKRACIGSFWMVGGACIILYATLLIYDLVARIEIDSAVVGGAVEPLKAPAAGRVSALSAGPNETFAAGTVLFRIEDPDLEQAIGLQRVAVERASNDLKLDEAKLAAERGRRDDWVANQRLEIEKTKALIAELSTQQDLLTKRCAELSDLLQRGLTQIWRLDDAQDKLMAARQGLSPARGALKEQETELELALSGQGIDGIEVIGRLAEMTEDVAHAKKELALSEEALHVLLRREAQAASVAAGPGRVLRVLRLPGSQVQAGDTVAVIERGARRFIYAYLTQDEVGHISVGDVVDIFLTAQRIYTRARVSGIERAGAYLDDVETRYDWRDNRDNPQRLTDRDRTARVTLDFEDADQNAAQAITNVGTPVLVSFSRRWDGMLPGYFSAMTSARQGK